MLKGQIFRDFGYEQYWILPKSKKKIIHFKYCFGVSI